VVASCTPRTHEPLFQETIRDAGLNRYLFDLADIREQCSWCHMGHREEATKKAIKLVETMIAKVKLLQPIKTETVGVTPTCHIVEMEKELGGLAKNLLRTPDGSDVQAFIASRIAEVQKHKRITVHTGNQLSKTEGFVGN